LAGGLVALGAIISIAGPPLGIMLSGLPYPQVDLIFAGVILAVLPLRGTVYCAPLRWPFAKLSGQLSYCIYLIHFGVIDAYGYFLKTRGIDATAVLGPRGAVIVKGVVVVSVTFALAALSRRFLEQPILGLKKHFEYRSGERQAEQVTPAVTLAANPTA
jgi:peptidoglycan/LPS O-acetylase OafA/YrhL